MSNTGIPQAEGCICQEHKHMNRKRVIKAQYFKYALQIPIPPESAEFSIEIW